MCPWKDWANLPVSISNRALRGEGGGGGEKREGEGRRERGRGEERRREGEGRGGEREGEEEGYIHIIDKCIHSCGNKITHMIHSHHICIN